MYLFLLLYIHHSILCLVSFSLVCGFLCSLFSSFISTLSLIPSLVTDNPFRCNLYILSSPSIFFYIMLFLSIRVVILSRSLFNCFTSAFILFFPYTYIPTFSLFLAPYISLTTTVATYNKSFNSLIFSSGLQ